MAEGKNKKAMPGQSNKEKNSPQKKRSSASSGKSRASGTSGQGRRKKSSGKSQLQDEIMVLLSFAVALILILSNFNLAGSIGQKIKWFMFGIFGVTEYIFPVIMAFTLLPINLWAAELDKAGHPAKQIFQALRIEVNDELNALEEALIGSIKRLKRNGRIVVITFQSLEDRIVKNIFRKYSVIEGNRINDYINPKDIKTPDYQVINRKVITPSDEELESNHRSKSAKLRILEKVK